MKHEVIRSFEDMQDNNHLYSVGDKFPHKGKVTKERIEELSTENNNFRIPFIVEVGEK